MNRIARGIATVVVLWVISSCSSNGQEPDGTFTSPEPPDEWASGLTIACIPEGFSWVWNEGHEAATFHTFQTEDESEQLSIGIQIAPPPHPGSGEVVRRGDREFTVYNEGNQIRVTEDVGNDSRIDVLSDSLDTERLLRIAESVTYEPGRDS
ncbi:MAG: hypothetical protein ACRDWA_05025 [Acidimicrobiia bacterium]